MKKLVLAVMMSLALLTNSASAQYPWMSVYGSGVFPSGEFDDFVDNGFGGGVGLGMFVNPMMLVKATASYHKFGDEDISGITLDGGFAPLEVGTNLYLGYFGTMRPYISLHGGWYVATGDFEDSAFGLGVGPGLEIPLNSPNTTLFIEPTYHIVFPDDDEALFGDENLEYWGIHFGMTFSFAPPSPIQQ